MAIVAQPPGRSAVAVRSFAPTPTSAHAARAFVRETLRLHDVANEVAQVLVSELAANAIRHARTEFEVRVGIDPDRVHVEVVDHDPLGDVDHDPAGDAALDARDGRRRYGLRLVDGFAARWGIDLGRDEKAVWFEVPTYPTSFS